MPSVQGYSGNGMSATSPPSLNLNFQPVTDDDYAAYNAAVAQRGAVRGHLSAVLLQVQGTARQAAFEEARERFQVHHQLFVQNREENLRRAAEYRAMHEELQKLFPLP